MKIKKETKKRALFTADRISYKSVGSDNIQFLLR